MQVEWVERLLWILTYQRVPCGQICDLEVAARGPVRRGDTIRRWLGLVLYEQVLLNSLETCGDEQQYSGDSHDVAYLTYWLGD